MTERIDGFYWVLDPEDGWIVALYQTVGTTWGYSSGHQWWVPGNDMSVKDEYFHEIDPTPLLREAAE